MCKYFKRYVALKIKIEEKKTEEVRTKYKYTWCSIHLCFRRFPSSYFVRPNVWKRKKNGRCVYLNYRCPWKNASLPASLHVRTCVHVYVYIRGCEYTLTAVLLRLTSGWTTNASRKTWNRDRDLKIKLDYCRNTFSISFPIYTYIFLRKFLLIRFLSLHYKLVR